MGDWVRRSAVTLTKGSSNTLFAVREPSCDVVVHPLTWGPGGKLWDAYSPHTFRSHDTMQRD